MAETQQEQTPAQEERTDAAIEASIAAKIQAAVDHAVANGDVDPEAKIGAFVAPDGSIVVSNVADPDAVSTPDPVELPDMYNEERESLTDSYYKDHLETHWGF